MSAGGDADLSVPLDLRVAAWLRTAKWLRRLGAFPTMDTMPEIPLARRKATKPPRWLTLPIPADVRIEDRAAGELGLPVAVRVYATHHRPEPPPTVMFIHGGGFVNGGLDSMQFLCAHVASRSGVTVVSVDYPLAPESPFPAALHAVYDVLCWLAEHGRRLGADPAHIAVMGDSAGGNLAAALCLLTRELAGPRITRQVLMYPALDATLSTPRMLLEAADRRAECDAFFTHYVGGADRRDGLVSPLLADDLSGLPPALVITAEHDALRDDGRLYGDRLREAGVRVRYTNYLGMPHGFLSMPRLCRAAPQALAEIGHELTTREARGAGRGPRG